MKGIVQNLFTRNSIAQLSTVYENDTVLWKWKKQPIARAYKVATEPLKLFDIKQEVLFAIIHWDVFVKAASAHKIKYAEVPKFPSMQRDLAIILEKNISYQQVQQATEQLNIQSLQDYDLFDVFENEKIGTDKKSYALTYTFQLNDRTLTDTEIEQHMQQLANVYETMLNAQIRK